MARHNDIGKWGEQLAVELLVSKGYAICQTNWRKDNFEIDIIAMKGNRIVFVEVKTRTSDIVDPLVAIDRRKMDKMIRAANCYILTYHIPHEYQFDLIFIIGSPESPDAPTIEHIQDAFLPSPRYY